MIHILLDILVWYIIPMLTCHLLAYMNKKDMGDDNIVSKNIFALSFIPIANIFGFFVTVFVIVSMGVIFVIVCISKKVKIKILIDYKNFIVGKK